MENPNNYSSNEEFIDDLFMKVAYLEAVSDESDDEDFFQVNDHPRLCLPDGDVTSRVDRAAPRPFLPSVNGLLAIRIHFGMDGEWGRFYFLPDAPPIPGSLAWDDFRENFRVPVPLFN